MICFFLKQMQYPTPSQNCEKQKVPPEHCSWKKYKAILRQFQTSLLMENLKLIEVGNEL